MAQIRKDPFARKIMKHYDYMQLAEFKKLQHWLYKSCLKH